MSDDWRTRFSADSGLEVGPPTSEDQLQAAEAALGAVFSSELRDLYRVADGVFNGPGQWFMVWPISEVVARNRADWTSAVGVGERLELIGFGDDGAGSPFCVRRNDRPGVVVWCAIGSESIWLADTLMDFWDMWQAGVLPHY